LLYLVASSTAWLFAGRIASGLAIGLGASATTAWIAELTPDKRRATLYATEANFLGLASGALIAGLLATYLPWPMRLSFVVYLALLGALGLALVRAPETVSRPVRSASELSLRPRLGVPRELFGAFLPPATIGFAAFAVIGYYAALVPGLLAEALNRRSLALGGLMLALLAVLGAAAGLVFRRLTSRAAMLLGSALLLPGLALLPCAEGMHSMALLILGTAVVGVATVLAYRGSLEVVNEIAPADRRAELISSYILCMYAGNSLPIIGIGVLSTAASSLAADIAFAIIVAAFVLLALIASFGARPGGRHVR
jgi:hypothetical protein